MFPFETIIMRCQRFESVEYDLDTEYFCVFMCVCSCNTWRNWLLTYTVLQRSVFASKDEAGEQVWITKVELDEQKVN